MNTNDHMHGPNPPDDHRPERVNSSGDAHLKGDRAQLAKPIKIIELPVGKVSVRANAIIADHDETISVGTGEHVHDGPNARFAQGLSMAVMDFRDEFGSKGIVSIERQKRYSDTNTIFCEREWVAYRSQSGKSEEQVLRGMVDVLCEREGIDTFYREELVGAFRGHAAKVLSHGFIGFMANVELDTGMHRLLERALQEGIPAAVVSASQESVVIDTLRHFELISKDSRTLIHAVIGNAVKKVDANTFCGKDISKACERLGVPPSCAVMFGDSIGDVGAAARAGIRRFFICCREEGSMDTLRKEIESFQAQERYNKELVSRGETIEVYLLKSFEQVELEGRIPAGENQATCIVKKQVPPER